MDGGLQILKKIGQNVWWAREEEGKNREERGKGKNRASSGVKGLCRTTFSSGTKGAGGAPDWQHPATTHFSTGPWYEPVLKVGHEPVLMKAAG